MSPRTPELRRSRLAQTRRWWIPAALLGLAPKCVLCLLAYAGLGAALGLGGPELCGGTSSAPGPWAMWWPMLCAAGSIAALLTRPGGRAGKLQPESRNE